MTVLPSEEIAAGPPRGRAPGLRIVRLEGVQRPLGRVRDEEAVLVVGLTRVEEVDVARVGDLQVATLLRAGRRLARRLRRR